MNVQIHKQFSDVISKMTRKFIRNYHKMNIKGIKKYPRLINSIANLVANYGISTQNQQIQKDDSLISRQIILILKDQGFLKIDQGLVQYIEDKFNEYIQVKAKSVHSDSSQQANSHDKNVVEVKDRKIKLQAGQQQQKKQSNNQVNQINNKNSSIIKIPNENAIKGLGKNNDNYNKLEALVSKDLVKLTISKDSITLLDVDNLIDKKIQLFTTLKRKTVKQKEIQDQKKRVKMIRFQTLIRLFKRGTIKFKNNSQLVPTVQQITQIKEQAWNEKLIISKQ